MGRGTKNIEKFRQCTTVESVVVRQNAQICHINTDTTRPRISADISALVTSRCLIKGAKWGLGCRADRMSECKSQGGVYARKKMQVTTLCMPGISLPLRATAASVVALISSPFFILFPKQYPHSNASFFFLAFLSTYFATVLSLNHPLKCFKGVHNDCTAVGSNSSKRRE
jgi:hypothetical protein